jgi:hypothetical protein
MVLPRFITSAKAGLPLRVFGDGSQTRCFCHVSDTVEALRRLLRCPAARGQVVNVGATEEVSIRGLARLVINTIGSASVIEEVTYDIAYAPGFEDMRRRRPTVERLARLTGFRAVVVDGIVRQTAEWPAQPGRVNSRVHGDGVPGRGGMGQRVRGCVAADEAINVPGNKAPLRVPVTNQTGSVVLLRHEREDEAVGILRVEDLLADPRSSYGLHAPISQTGIALAWWIVLWNCRPFMVVFIRFGRNFCTLKKRRIGRQPSCFETLEKLRSIARCPVARFVGVQVHAVADRGVLPRLGPGHVTMPA